MFGFLFSRKEKRKNVLLFTKNVVGGVVCLVAEVTGRCGVGM